MLGLACSPVAGAQTPQDDFYRFANARWLAGHALAPGESSQSLHQEVEQQTRLECQELLREHPGALGALYASVENLAARERVGIQPLQPLLERIEASTDHKQLAALVGFLQRYEIHVMIRLASTRRAEGGTGLGILLYGRGLPDLAHYRENSPAAARAREAYLDYLTRSFTLLGRTKARLEAESVLAFERELADLLRQDHPSGQSRVSPVASLAGASPQLDWNALLSSFGLQQISSFSGSDPQLLVRASRLWGSTSVAALQSYARARLLIRYAKFMPPAYRRELFTYYRAVSAQPLVLPEGVRTVEELMPQQLGAAWSARYLDAEARTRALELAEDARAAFRARLAACSWMSADTRQEAVRKLERLRFRLELGHQEDGPSLDPENLLANALTLRQRNRDRLREAILGQSPPPGERPVVESNAEYLAAENTVVILAGLLRPPFLDADRATTLGALGSVLGHEMTHGFDNRGVLYDAEGRVRPWWAPLDLAHFAQLTRALEQQLAVTPGVRAPAVSEEAMADLGGLRIAYDALGKVSRDEEQRFFLSFARSHVQVLQPNLETLSLRMDEHPPEPLRVNLCLANFPEFWSAFQCQRGQPMVHDPPVRLW